MQVLILPGDGIGPEIAAAARRALEALDARFALGLRLSEGRVGLARWNGTERRGRMPQRRRCARRT